MCRPRNGSRLGCLPGGVGRARGAHREGWSSAPPRLSYPVQRPSFPSARQLHRTGSFGARRQGELSVQPPSLSLNEPPTTARVPGGLGKEREAPAACGEAGSPGYRRYAYCMRGSANPRQAPCGTGLRRRSSPPPPPTAPEPCPYNCIPSAYCLHLLYRGMRLGSLFMHVRCMYVSVHVVRNQQNQRSSKAPVQKEAPRNRHPRIIASHQSKVVQTQRKRH